ncbi:hypothetical protein C2E23DRAFT_890271 [Lenzites betulinus]|nr:hypothetical protein C2E23DRAFT_890271 [Lenzites betulinus]
MDSSSLLRTELLLLFFESLFFGAFCCLYIISLWILLYRHRRSERFSSSLWMTGVVTAMFCLAGTFLALDVRHLMAAFVDHSDTPGGTLAYLWQQGSDPSRNADPIIFILMTFLGDAFMTYRIFVVWNRQWISLVAPIAFIAGDLIAAAFIGQSLAQGNPKNFDTLLTPSLHSRLIAYFSMTLVTNLATTLLLLGRLWWCDRQAKRYCPPQYRAADSVHWRVMHTIVYSQIAYSFAVVLNLAACVSGTKLVVITSAILQPIIGISFTLIILRIGISEVLPSGRERTATLGGSHAAVTFGDRVGSAGIAVSVHVTQTIDSDGPCAFEDKTVSACHDASSVEVLGGEQGSVV